MIKELLVRDTLFAESLHVVSLSKRLYPLLDTDSTQEDLSRHD